jgi:raffinose/stachyose/melibiose transport system substrate-binding protein
MKRSIGIFVLAITFVLGLSLQSAHAGGTQGSGDKTDLRLFHRFGPTEARGTVTKETIQLFKDSHPSINLIEELDTEYDTKFKTVMASGDLPDVFVMRTSWINELVALEAIKPLDSMINSDTAYKSIFTDSAFNNCVYNGQIYAAPVSVDINSVLFWNKALFDKYNLSFPKDWNDLLNVIKVFNANGIIPIAMGNKATWVAESSYLGLFVARIGGIDYANRLFREGNAKFTDPPFVEALTRMRELVEARAFNSDFASIDNFQQRVLYGSGQTAMIADGSFGLTVLLQNTTPEVLADTHVNVFPIIPSQNGHPAAVDGGSGWGWNYNAKLTGDKEKAAQDFVKLGSGANWGKRLYETAQMLFPMQGVAYDTNKLSDLFKKTVAAVEGVPITPVPDQVLPAQVETELEACVAAVLIGTMTPQDAAASIQAVKDRMR